MLFIFNSIIVYIKVLCCDSFDDGFYRSVFVNFYGVQWFVEYWWFIYIQYVDFYCSSIFKWFSRVKAVVKVKVGGFYFKSICFFGFKI